MRNRLIYSQFSLYFSVLHFISLQNSQVLMSRVLFQRLHHFSISPYIQVEIFSPCFLHVSALWCCRLSRLAFHLPGLLAIIVTQINWWFSLICKSWKQTYPILFVFNIYELQNKKFIKSKSAKFLWGGAHRPPPPTPGKAPVPGCIRILTRQQQQIWIWLYGNQHEPNLTCTFAKESFRIVLWFA